MMRVASRWEPMEDVPLCCARPHGLELLAGRPPRTAGLRVLQTGPENLAFLQILACSETFVIIALYKSTFTIPYHTIPLIGLGESELERLVRGRRREAALLLFYGFTHFRIFITF